MRTTTTLIGAGAVLAAILVPSAAHAAPGQILVPDDFVPALSDTRATGHYEIVGTGLRVYTEGATSTDKVAEYVATDRALADVGEPSLTWTGSNPPPGFQLVVDFDADGTPDGILVGEPVYAGDWWASNGSAQFVKDGAPSHTGGAGSANHGTLDQWRAAFPDAEVLAFGFSLGSGVLGDGVISALTIGGDVFTFTDQAPVVEEPPAVEVPNPQAPAAPVPAEPRTLAETGAPSPIPGLMLAGTLAALGLTMTSVAISRRRRTQ